MAVIGEASQVVWSEELRRNGRVVFTLRASWVLKRLGVVWLGAIVVALRSLDADATGATDAKVRLAFTVLFFAMAIGISAWHGWRIFRQHPALTVDQNGIRAGRDRFLPWSEVGTIGFTRGGLGQKRLPIIPKDQWAKELTVDQSAIKDIPAFARWLEGVLAEQRAAGSN
ncbi:hypothetical protein [Kribbella catacumbae]|uniref:hypothetical protein n=1 Tax=Kribbella catacumbae TaxID=460086 RepID=UPI000360EEB3|nr:hypothetical protein [Kribbella catacumbae]